MFQNDWDSVRKDNVTVNDACNKLLLHFSVFVKYVFRGILIHPNPNNKPWFNSELRSNMRLKNRLRKKSI